MYWKPQESLPGPLSEERFFLASTMIIFISILLMMRLWYIQIYCYAHYSRLAENNRIRRIEISAPRGIIFDRFGKKILGNRPFYDLVLIPQYVTNENKTLKILSHLLHIPRENLEKIIRNNQGRPKFLPITIKRNLSPHEVAIIQTQRIFLPGIDINVAARRDYSTNPPSHLVGYMGEISPESLKEKNSANPKNPYYPGDFVGKQGLEARWENHLRGHRGYRLIQVDAFGRQTQFSQKDEEISQSALWNLAVQTVIPGNDLILTIDRDLQNIVQKSFQGKYGAVVVLNPRTGEILAMLSSPQYDPTMYQDSLSLDRWRSLVADPYKPLFDKTTGGVFPPGSIYKPLVALAGLEEKIISTHTKFLCTGAYEMGGDHTFHCHNRRGHGSVDLQQALIKSCDVYFYHLGMELGIDRIAKYAHALGLGKKLGLQLNREDPGLIPTTAWKRQTSKSSWNAGDIPSLAIGQGANLMTPLQMASLYASLANGGQVWRPFVVSKVVSPLGETVLHMKPELLWKAPIKEENLAIIRNLLGQVVSDPGGLGRYARVPQASVAGKTGSAQVVSLSRARNRQVVMSMKWQEHALFGAFSPIENAEIALAVLSENDKIGGGMSAAAPIAGKIIEAYWALKAKRQEKGESSS